MAKDRYHEFCECGGKAFIKIYGELPLLKCIKCGEEFEAHEDWIKSITEEDKRRIEKELHKLENKIEGLREELTDAEVRAEELQGLVDNQSKI